MSGRSVSVPGARLLLGAPAARLAPHRSNERSDATIVGRAGEDGGEGGI